MVDLRVSWLLKNIIISYIGISDTYQKYSINKGTKWTETQVMFNEAYKFRPLGVFFGNNDIKVAWPKLSSPYLALYLQSFDLVK